MSKISSFSPRLDPSAVHDLHEWQTRVLDGILRGIFILWMFALISGINNVVEAYKEETGLHPNPFLIAASVISFYLLFTLLLAYITFNRKLNYAWRAGLLIFVFYAIGAIGLALSSFSGDGRIFLFMVILLAAILFDLRTGIISLFAVLVTFIILGWLQISEVIVVPDIRQINSSDLGAWISGGIVFIVLSVASLVSITYLLRTLGQSLIESRKTLAREQHLGRILRMVSDINQLIVRETDRQKLLVDVCQILFLGRGYAFVWVGLLEADGVTLKLAAFAGESIDPELFTIHLDREESNQSCAAMAIRSRNFFRVDSSSGDDPCKACPRRLKYPLRTAIALPLLREDHTLGANYSIDLYIRSTLRSCLGCARDI